MKKYSYVDASGDFKGPHTIEDLLQLKELKVIGEPTQILDESSRRLTTLREILSTRTGPVVFSMTPASAAAPPTVVTPTSRSKGVCIACGGKIPATSAQCPYCQMDTQRSEITGRDFIQALGNRLAKIQTEVDDLDKGRAKANAIATFNMPNDKENLLEFFTLCDSNVSTHGSWESMWDAPELHDAWYGKAKMAYIKMKVYARDDPTLLSLLSPYGQKYETETYLRGARRQSSLLLYGILGFGLLIVVLIIIFEGLKGLK